MASLLLVEDEEALARLLAQYLTRQGHQVSICTTAGRALSLLADPGGYSLVIADLSLPDMAGVDLLRRLWQIAPRMDVVVASGHPLAETSLPAPAAARVRLLQKPFRPSALADVVGELLAAAPPAGQPPANSSR